MLSMSTGPSRLRSGRGCLLRAIAALAAVAVCGAVAADAVAQGTVATDRAALEALYDATDGSSWTRNTNWKTSAPLGEWYGVTTDADGRVRGLSLRRNELTGPIPEELGSLANLEWLSLTGNGLTGPIPAWLGRLVNLVTLELSSNDLTGSIPAALGRLVNLKSLRLSFNELTGPIPDALASLVNLETLSLWRNALTGPVPVWLGSMTQLRRLNLAANALTGPIPAQLENLVNLESLWLGPNDLTGPVPAWLGNLAQLRSLNLGGNPLTGPIPGALASLVHLESLTLSVNDLTGPVPAWLGNMTQLRWLDLASNALTGPIPEELGNLSNLDTLRLNHNELTGPIPRELGGLVNLLELGLSGNGLTGPMPAELGSLVNLEWLSLGGNELTGPIPEELGSLANLRSLYLGSNALTGPVPAWFGSLANLEGLDLRGNELTGPIPEELGSLANLRSLSLYSNALTGPIPASLGSLVNLEWLDLGWNELTGPIPSELGNLENLERLYLSDNDLSGLVSEELGSLVNLEELYLSPNWGLSGPLPTGLQESGLEELDIFLTQACAPAAWREWLETIEFWGAPCEAGPEVTIDVAVVYTPGARVAAGGAAAIEAEIDLMIAETNEAYAASGVRQRLALVARSEVPYTETSGGRDLTRLNHPSDGHLDEAHALRDGTGADLVHLIVGESGGSFYNVCGIADLPGPFGITLRDCGGITFAHELGHNMGLRHDRFQVQVNEGSVSSHPAYGYANQRMLEAGAPPSSRWVTIMAYSTHCRLADVTCSTVPRFSNPRQRYNGDPLGIAYGAGSGMTDPADASAVLNATGPAVAAWREGPLEGANRPPMAVQTLPDRSLGPVGSVLDVDVSPAFVDPDGDALAYAVSSSAPWVAGARATGARVTLTAVGEGAATIRVTGTDPGGLSVAGSFSATVEGGGDTDPQGSVESDRAGLEALYDATDGPNWTESTSWKTEAPLGEWHGVRTDADGRVTELSLRDNGLTGLLPFEVGNLTNLERLNLGDNALTGPIPSALASLVNLEQLYLWRNELTGPVPPSLGNLVNLRSLSLAGNDLTGPLPGSFGNLVNLRSLELESNGLTGPLPSALGGLVNLRWLHLSGNDLTGPIPSALGGLVNLEGLSLGWNRLTGPVPAWLGNLVNLRWLYLSGNDLTGPIPDALGSLVNLETLGLDRNDLSGSIPRELGSLANLERLDLSYNWGLSGPVPAGLEESGIDELDIFVTRICAPAAWEEWLATIEFLGPLCEAGPEVTIDVAIVYTPAAREAAGGAAAIEAAIDLMIAETNEAYAASGVNQRVALVGRSEVPYTQWFWGPDLDRLADPSDGYMDEAHALRDETGADLVHLIVAPPYSVCGVAFLPQLGWPGPFAITLLNCGGLVFAHELGHNMGLFHDRFQVQVNQSGVTSDPAYGYANQRMLEAGAPPSSRWRTIMAYSTRCRLTDAQRCARLPRFSNPRQRYQGDPLGVAFEAGTSGVTGPADAVAVLNATGPAAAAWRDPPAAANRPPAAVGTLPDRRLTLNGTLEVDVSQAFVDPDGDALSYTVSSAAPHVVTVLASDARVTLTAVGVGTATVRVTATDPGGLSATQSFTTRVTAPFTDDPIRPGVTPVRAVHFTELRTRIDLLRLDAGLARFGWTDPVLRAGVTPVRLVHVAELREALAAAYAAAGRPAPRWTDAAPVAGLTPIRAVHLLELRAAVVALE